MGVIARVCGTTPANEFFQWVGDNAPCSGLATQAFRRTIAQKLDAQGQPRVLDIRNLRTDVVTRGTDISYIEDIETGDLYLDEGRHVIAGKCVDIAFLGVPVYLVTIELFNLFRTAFLASALAIQTIRQVGEKLCEGDFGAMGSVSWNGVCEIGSTLAVGVADFVKAPFYAIGMQFAALYGIVDQYRGRKWVAAIEHSWQKGVSYREDLVQSTPNPNEPFCTIESLKKARIPYLANCFQVQGNVNQGIRVVRHESL